MVFSFKERCSQIRIADVYQVNAVDVCLYCYYQFNSFNQSLTSNSSACDRTKNVASKNTANSKGSRSNTKQRTCCSQISMLCFIHHSVGTSRLDSLISQKPIDITRTITGLNILMILFYL